MERSADGAALTVVTCVAELSLRFGSSSFAATLAVLLMPPVCVGVTTSVTVAELPFARDPSAQLIVLVPVQLLWLGVTETNVSPAGSVSLTLTPVAALGPLFVTVIVYVRLPPTMTGSGESALVMLRSAAGGFE